MILCGLGVLAAYAATLSVLPRDVFWMPDPGAKYLELAAVHWAGGLRYDVPFPSRRIDPTFAFLPLPGIFPHPLVADDGRMFLPFETPVLFPLMSRVPLAWFGMTGLYLLPLLSGWCCALVSGEVMRRIYPVWAPVTVLLVGLATPMWFYSVNFWEHTVACLLALLAVYLAIASPQPRLAAGLGMLAFLTAAVSLRIEMLAFALALLLGWTTSMLAVRPRRTVPESCGSTLTAGVPWVFNLLLVGCVIVLLAVLNRSLTVRHRAFLAAAPARTVGGISNLLGLPRSLVEVFVHSSVSEGAAVAPVVADLGIIAVFACCAAAFVRSPLAEATLLIPGCVVLLDLSLYLLCTPQPYRSVHGFFPIAPFLALWPYAWREAWRSRDYTLLAVTNLVFFGLLLGFAAVAISYAPTGHLMVGLEWGQRYLLVLYPLLTIAALAGLRIHRNSGSERPEWLRRALTTLVAAMVVVSVGLEVRGLRMLDATGRQLSSWQHALEVEPPIVTDLWWLPSAVARLFVDHEMFFVTRRSETAAWAMLAAAHGVSRFTFASLTPVATGELGTPAIRRLGERSVSGLRLTSYALEGGHTP